MSTASTDSLTWGLDPDQLAAVVSDAQPLCLLAGAGAGKTRVLTRRVARRIIDESAAAEHTMVLTFTRKAAGELRDRLKGLGISHDITVGTFHAVAFAQLRRRWLDQNKAAPQVSSNPIRILEAAIENLRMQRSIKARHLSVEIAWAKSRNLTPDTYEESIFEYKHRPPISPSQFAKVFAAYEAEKRKRGVVDYDDLLTLMTDALKNDRNFAAAQRWKFRHFFVDEFQDLNSAQFELLKAWLGDRNDLFVVGDPNQAIYGWNGADATFLTQIEKQLPGIEKLKLGVNYRSTPEVLRAAASVLSEGEVKGSEDLAAGGRPPVVQMHVDEVHEAISIARMVRRIHGDGFRWADIAILVRTNAQREPIETALRKYNIPHRSAGGVAWMKEPEVKEAINLLRHSAGKRLEECAKDIKDEHAEKTTALDELVKAVRECLDDDPQLSVTDFLSWLEIASRNDGPSATSVAGVTVSTFHRAKGLEWPVVILAGVEDGLVPMGGMNSSQVEEERRLFYVAITRARERLICTWAQQRGVAEREPSPWLENIERSARDNAVPDVTPESALEHLVETREVLHLEPRDTTARDGLLKWRLARAKLSAVEPKLILSDALCDAIIDIRPKTKEELAAIDGFGSVRANSIGHQILAAINSTD